MAPRDRCADAGLKPPRCCCGSKDRGSEQFWEKALYVERQVSVEKVNGSEPSEDAS